MSFFLVILAICLCVGVVQAKSRIAVTASVFSLIYSFSAEALELPAPEQLSASLGKPVDIRVFEPNLTHSEVPIAVEYTAYPAVAVLALLLGQNWRSQAPEIEFKALDGYVSRIDSSRFETYPAYLAFDRADGADFAVDVPAQNQRNVPLGPYYLIWDNLQHPELLVEGGRYWPYQVGQIGFFYGFGDILTPATLDPEFLEGAQLVQSSCLSCHQMKGVGGEMFPIDLVLAVRDYEIDRFSRWLLEPSSVKPGTQMPPLSPALNQQERERMAKAIYDYLQQMR